MNERDGDIPEDEHKILAELEPGLGFVVVVFDHTRSGAPAAYTSNVPREFGLLVLREMIERLDGSGGS